MLFGKLKGTDVSDPFQAQGAVARAFESFKTLYEREMRTLAEENARLYLYHRGEKVLELWGPVVGE